MPAGRKGGQSRSSHQLDPAARNNRAWQGERGSHGSTYIHSNGDDHELGVESDERLVLDQAMLLEKAVLHHFEEVPVEIGIDNENEDFRNTVPVLVDIDESVWIGSELT